MKRRPKTILIAHVLRVIEPLPRISCAGLKLNQHFDPWQSKVAQPALEESSNTAAG